MRCPVCRAENGFDAVCRRCRADLAILAGLERRRLDCLARSRACLCRADGNGALRYARQAHRLRADADTARLCAIACLMAGRFAELLGWRQRALWAQTNAQRISPRAPCHEADLIPAPAAHRADRGT